jgi:glycosyltransferase involved in cell wall biosynthesis
VTAVGAARVSFVALNYLPSTGGSQEYVRRVAEALAARGHDVEVLTTDALRSPSASDPGRVGRPDDTIAGVRVRRFPVPGPVRRVQLLVRYVVVRGPWAHGLPRASGPWLAGPLAPGLARATRRAVRDRDVVVACSAPFSTFALPSWGSRRRRRAAVVGLPFLHVARVAPHRSVGRALRRCDALVAMTPVELADAGGPLPAVRVIPPGTDAVLSERTPSDARRRLGLPARTTIGFVGRLAAYKGIDVLLASAPAVWEAHPDVTVLVAGATTGWDGLEGAIEGSGSPDRVEVRTDLSDEERDFALAACDVVALPSLEESFGLVIAEAWAAGRPVVAADIAAVRSTVRDGEDALLVPPADPGALASAVIALLDDPERRTALGHAGRDRVEHELRWSVAADRWSELVDDLRSAVA